MIRKLDDMEVTKLAKYITEQRKELISFFTKNPDKQFTSRQIANLLQNQDISQSAVYRNLAALEEEGMLCRSVKEGSREFYYQYVHLDECINYIHMTCVKCSKIIHAPSKATERMLETISSEVGFMVDKTKTVLYGLCKECIIRDTK